MAQKSIPWGYLLGDDSLVGYVAKEDSSIRLAIARAGGMIVDGGIRTLAALANLGPFYSVANRYAVTNPGAAANRVDVDTGASLACGVFHYNSASIGGVNDLTAPAANPRIDRVVVRVNFSAVDYVPASASAALFTVPAYTARVTIIHGAENPAPVAPALTQDTNRATYWDIPLYQYQISVAGAISAITDEREFADIILKKIYVAPIMGYNDTDATEIRWYNAAYGMSFPDTKSCLAVGATMTPPDLITMVGAKAIVTPAAGGDAYSQAIASYNAEGEGTPTHQDTIGYAAVAVANGIDNRIQNCPMASAAAGDWIELSWQRDATDPLDTIGAAVDFKGWEISYWGLR